MKSLKLNAFHKFICFAVIIVLILSMLGFAKDGWQITNVDNNGNADILGNGEADIQTSNKPTPDGSTQPSGDSQQSGNLQEKPTDSDLNDKDLCFTNVATGLKITEDEYNSIPMGIIVDPSLPLYGVSGSDISIEFPIEDGSSRLLTYTTNKEIMWKIGTLKATRNYISNMSNFFGGVVVSYGKDDVVAYSAWETDKIELDLSKYSDCYYVDNTLYIYTTEAMIEAAKNRMSSIADISSYKAMPYSISETEIIGKTNAENITVPYSDENQTKLIYSSKTGKYLFYKSENLKIDMLTGENLAYTNVFILFANATTYENANGTELVLDTAAGGKGYYISKGTLTEFNWQTTKNGELVFKNLMGDVLPINAGCSYLAFYKAARSVDIKIS